MASKGSAGKRKGNSILSALLSGGGEKPDRKDDVGHEQKERHEKNRDKEKEKDRDKDRDHKEKGGLRKLAKKSSLFSLRGQIDEANANASQDNSSNSLSPLDNTDRVNPMKSVSNSSKTLKKVRPASVFGSLKNRHASTNVADTLEEEVDDSNGGHSYPASPINDDMEQCPPALSYKQSTRGRSVQLHGEVQTTSGMFRKKKEYLVLTDTHLLRYKSQTKAADAFPNAAILPSSRSGTMRHSSTASIGSFQDLQSLKSYASTESNDNAIPLKYVIATYRNDQENKNIFTADIVHLDENHNSLGSLQITLPTRNETDIWHSSIRAASQKARLVEPQSYPPRVVEYLVRILTAANDFDPECFKLFRVVKRLPSKNAKASNDDLKGLSSNVHYMVIGMSQVHLISLPDFTETSLVTMDAKATRQSFGLVTLINVNLEDDDDKLELIFRSPLQPPVTLDLAAASAPEIVTLIHKSLIYIKPQWLEFTYLYAGPQQLIVDEVPDLSDDMGWFDRTLIAYCAAYKCNPARICYWVEYEIGDDSPEFRLLPPNSGSATYSALELLAIFRALRYNESFTSISFAGVSLQALYGIVDLHGKDHVALAPRPSRDIRTTSRPIIDPAGRSLLYQEVQALALKAVRIKKLDLSGTLPRKRVKDTFDDDGDHIEKDPGCDYPAAIFPLARARWTSVDYLTLNGIELAETDLDEISRALADVHRVKWRGLEVARCGLTNHALQLLLKALERQTTLQRINISDNPGTIRLNEFSIFSARFYNLRSINLSRTLLSKGETSLLDPDALCSWQLEELILDGITLNEKTLEAISAYLATDKSQNLHLLQLEQCNLTGYHVASLMRSMCRNISPGAGRPLSLNVSNNRLEQGNGEIVKAIEENCTPHQLIMRMVTYNTESRFRQLLHALRINTTIHTLDISKASLAKDADPDTCLALKSLFEDNGTLIELDISGEQAHLETTRFGIGLSSALQGLSTNTSLRVLKIEYQSLGMEGANTLASVLRANNVLRSIYCENNGLNQQGYRVLVEALAENFTLTYLPECRNDQAENIRDILKKLSGAPISPYSNVPDHVIVSGPTMQGVRDALSKVGISKTGKEGKVDTPQNQAEVHRTLGEAWRTEVQKMRTFVERNYAISQGYTTREEWERGEQAGREDKNVVLNEADLLNGVANDATPKVESHDPIEEMGAHMSSGESEADDALSINDENGQIHHVVDIHDEENIHNEHGMHIDKGGLQIQTKSRPQHNIATPPPPEIIIGSYGSEDDMVELANAMRAYGIGNFDGGGDESHDGLVDGLGDTRRDANDA